MKYQITQLTSADLKDYPKAILKELTAIKKAKLSFIVYSHTENLIKEGSIRLKEGFSPLPKGEYNVENTTYRGKSPLDAYTGWETRHKSTEGANLHPMCLLQYLRLIQQYPDFLKEKLYLDFCADELRYGSDWSDCPFVDLSDSAAYLDGSFAGVARDDCGSLVCAWESTGDLNVEPLAISDPLTFDSDEIRKLKELAKLLK